ncbi:MAG: serine protein kinase RIO [Nocardioides sp.]
MPADDLDPRFVCDFSASADPDESHQRWSTWLSVQPLCRGPHPRPEWVVTAQGAVDTELGVLKSGKEADVFLLERGVPQGPSVVMAAKRYRNLEHRDFHRAAAYTDGRKVKRSRDQRAVKRKSTWGRTVASSAWAVAEFDALSRAWTWGLPVPYPVQIDGTEILMELITVEDRPAPRLAQTRPARRVLDRYFEQLRAALFALVERGVVHGDLSAFNILAAGDRIVIIDLPQVVDLIANPNGLDFLMRDCANVCSWFRARGLSVDEHALFAELLSSAH